MDVFLDKTQLVVTSLTTGFQVYTRSAGVAYFILGALSCSFTVKLLKRALRQPRPVGMSKKVTYGMPSTHSATITYYASYICAACIYLPLHRSLWLSPHDHSNRFTTIAPMIVIPWASLVVVSRVWLGHHTWEQVAVGSGYGASFAAVWFALWTRGGLAVLGEHGKNGLKLTSGSNTSSPTPKPYFEEI